MSNATLLALALAAAPQAEADWSPPAPRGLMRAAKAVGQDSSDQALAALYQQLFRLSDLKREAELKSDGVDLTIADIAKEYKRHDRFVDGPRELREVAADPEHRNYPNPTESTKLQLLAEVRKQVRIQELAKLEIVKLERDIAKTEKLISEHLNRRGGATAR